MILQSVKLNNIRSYTNQEVKFDKGVVILSGDIGSGKSTILLAVEFALFGNLGTEGSLLRKGTNEGSVELNFAIDNRNFTLKRFLKRKSEGIRQTNGYIIANETKKEMTPIELKQIVTTLLGYPDESSKKSLIYRYTTYTPQEEMKQILYEDAEERIKAIRRIFGIDKYQKIIENSSTFARILRENKREMLGKLSDLEAKKEEIRKITEEKEVLARKEKEFDEQLKTAKENLEKIKNKISELELELKKSHETKREKLTVEASIKHREEQKMLISKDILRLEEQISALKKIVNPERVNELKTKIKKEIREEIAVLEREQMSLQRLIGEFEAIKNASERTKKQIIELNDCPMCRQNVTHDHKEKIKSDENEKITNAESKLNEINSKITELKTKLAVKNKELHESSNAERDLSLIELEIKNINEKEANILNKKELSEKISNEIKELAEKNNKIQLIDSEAKEKEYEIIKKELEKSQYAERSIEIEKTKITSDIKNSEKLQLMIEKDIAEKEKIKEKSQKITEIENWLQNNFTNIVALIEKHVLSKIYLTFNEFFKEIFELLIEDERMFAKIDENFTPIVDQNGYETEFSNLSGGEKTSISLAYRLALHKSLNDIMSNIKTRGLLMLDEPTDGFSSEQIDRLKDVFEKLNANQTVIVSHENKIESIADHVVRIVKKGHESQVL